MKKLLAIGLLTASFAFVAACGSDSKSDTTAQLYNDTTWGGSGWTAVLSVAKVSLSANTGSWSGKIKLEDCGDSQTATMYTPDGTLWTFNNVNVECEQHNLFTLKSSGGNPVISWSTGSER